MPDISQGRSPPPEQAPPSYLCPARPGPARPHEELSAVKSANSTAVKRRQLSYRSRKKGARQKKKEVKESVTSENNAAASARPAGRTGTIERGAARRSRVIEHPAQLAHSPVPINQSQLINFFFPSQAIRLPAVSALQRPHARLPQRLLLLHRWTQKLLQKEGRCMASVSGSDLRRCTK